MSVLAACGGSTEQAEDHGGSEAPGSEGQGSVDGGSDSAELPTGLPCPLAELLATHCTSCHGATPSYGAPMSLVDYGDLQVPATSDPTRKVYELVAERIEDPLRPMPQPPGSMSAAERAIVHDWIAAGTPMGDGSACELPEDDDEPVGPDALPCEPTVTFTAHAAGSDEGFMVPQQGAENLYVCATFKSPFAGNSFATAWAPITDDERVLHHWILYRTETPQEDGAVGPCTMPSDAQFVAGWAPGGENYVLPDDVALELGGQGSYFILNMHYNNAAQLGDAVDRSGVAMCTVDTPREQTAGILWLGSLDIAIPPGAEDHAVAGECPSWVSDFLVAPIYALTSFPHMHKLGRSLRTDIVRKEGPIETLVDVPAYDFQTQLHYMHEPAIELRPGDALRTTCTYDNPGDNTVYLGENTEDEMCFNFVTVYPIDLLGEYRQCLGF
ncbi:MAG: hypothetical protein IAG13_23815 [Deltaproteobacteria bacterium]|nr:hypothetical protein [Nannocystaceae bacterium]